MKTRAAYIMMVMLLLGAGFFFCRPAIADIYYADPSGHFDANAMGVGNTVIETPSATSGDCSSETYSSCRASATPVKLNVPAFNIAVGTQCKYITVNNGKTVFIPAKTANEWKSFMDWAGNPTRNGGQVDLHGCSDGMWTVWSGCSPACGPLAGTQYRMCVYTSNWKGNNCSALDAWGSSRACADYSTCVCAAKDANSTFCAGSDSGFTAMPPAVTYVNLGGCDGTKCQAACVANYHSIAGGCAINTCAPLTANATACNALTPPAHNQSYTLVAGCSASPCLATCNSGYFIDGTVCNITPVCGASPNTCSAGAPSGYDGPKACGGSVENWTCSSGSASIGCSLPTVACPSCGASANTCGTGSPAAYNADVCGGTSTWNCVNGSYTQACSKANAACPVCGAGNNTCTTGSPSGYAAGVCNGSATWTCSNGGYTQGCSNANAACPVCGAGANTCTLGSPSGYAAGSCNGAQTWTCSNGGYNQSCGIPNAACPVCGASNACTVGSPSGFLQGSCGGNATWTCTNGGYGQGCVLANPLNPTCGATSNTCGVGSPSGLSAGGCGSSDTWTCNNSWCTAVPCSHANGPCVCSPASVAHGNVAAWPACTITCDGGYYLNGSSCSLITYTGSFPACPSACGYAGGNISATTCTRDHDGASVAVSNCGTQACAATPSNPTCGASSNTCGVGSPSGLSAGGCGGTDTWTCNNAPCTPVPCSKSVGACAGCSIAAGTPWGGGCTADSTVNVSHGNSGTAFDTGGSTTGSISGTCTNGSWGGVSSTCTGPYTLGAWSACSPCGGAGSQTRSVTCSYDSCTGTSSSGQCCVSGACPAVCPDGSCSGGETKGSCPADCGYDYCGDGACQPPENASNCGDCPQVCGDTYCTGSEVCDGCVADCGVCPPPPY